MALVGSDKVCHVCNNTSPSIQRRCIHCGTDLSAAVAPEPGDAASRRAHKVMLVHPEQQNQRMAGPPVSGDPDGGALAHGVRPDAQAGAPANPGQVPEKKRFVHPGGQPQSGAPGGSGPGPHAGQAPLGPDGTVPMSPLEVQEARLGSQSGPHQPDRPSPGGVQSPSTPLGPSPLPPTAPMAPYTAPAAPAARSRGVRSATASPLALITAGLGIAGILFGLFVVATRAPGDEEPSPAASGAVPSPPPVSVTPLPTASLPAAPSLPATAPSASSAPAGPGAGAPVPPLGGPLDQSFREKLKNATVVVLMKIGRRDVGMGSGFFIDGDGLFATNHHVIDSKAMGARVAVRLYGREGEVDDVLCVADDPRRDLALLRVKGLPPPGVLDLYRGDRIPETTPVVVIGHPREEFWSITQGTITGYREHNGHPFYGTDARIEPGNSGGPVTLRGSGEVIGISDWKIRDTSMNYAIPVEALLALIRASADQPGRPCRP